MRKLISLLAVGMLVLPSIGFGATSKLEYSGWLPYWKKESGVAETLANLKKLNSVSPFSYELDAEVGVLDKIAASEAPWPQLYSTAKAGGVKIIPSIASMDPDLIHSFLSDPVKRRVHIEDIIGTVLIHDYDGVDIDYEGKYLKTKPYYSLFIKELATALHARGKLLSCTVESRTPTSSRFNVPRGPMEYANDYKVLNKNCDEVRIMAYDQANIDLKLNKSKGTKQFYLPVADPAWVEKVIKETLKEINRKKVVLGVPTYGYEYELGAGGVLPNFYDRTKSVTYAQAMATASSTNSIPVRNSAGEMSFMYFKQVNRNGVVTTEPRIVWFTDAQSIKQKIDLAKKYNLKGVSFFKFDGDSDQNFWQYVK